VSDGTALPLCANIRAAITDSADQALNLPVDSEDHLALQVAY
jgi:hypothetical protein